MKFFLWFLAVIFICSTENRIRAEDIRYPANSGVLNIKAAPYNAVGNGIADDTAAFQATLTASANGNTIYIPNGTYRITNTLSWPGNGGANITLQGQSQAGTILRLPDSTAGFTNASSPKVLLDGKGNHIPERFANSIRNLTVDTGIGNAGVIAVQYYANNMGACRDVTIKGQGLIGLEMSHTRANGPCYVVNTTVDGFQIGIRTGYAMESLVFENITLRNQSTVGWLNENVQRVGNGNTHLAASQTLSIRKLHASSLAVTAFKNPSGHVVMLDSTFAGIGGASSLHAIENGAPGQLLLRNISSTGYGRVLRDAASDVPGTSHGEWLSNPVVNQFPASPSTLNLPIQDAPTIPDEDPSTWANIKSFGATDWNASEGTRFDNDAPAIQAAIDSGATTIFIPAGSFRVLSQINVRGNVRRIVGVGGVSTVGAGNNGSGVPYQGIVWCIRDGTSPTVVIENMSCGYAVNMTGVDNQSARTLVLRDLVIQPPKFTGSGDIFIENIVTSYMEFNGQRAWARQLNVERDGDHIINRGGTLWILGLKTEDYGYILDASGGAKTEILGGMIYSLDDTSRTPMIRNSESSLSFSLAEYLGLYGKPYNTLVEETAQGVTRSLARLIPNTSTVANPAHWSQNKDGTTTGNSGVVGSGFLLYNSVVATLPLIAPGQSLTQNLNTTLSYSLQATNSPTSWSLISGSLPPGVTLNTATGLLSGAPTTLGTFTPGFTATNSHGTSSGVTVTLLVRPLAYDFNSTQANFNVTFLETTSSGSPAWASAGLIATGGINNTGYLATSPDAQSALIDAAFPWATGRSYTLSVYFKARVTTGSVAAGGGLRLGFADDNLGTLQGGEYVAAGINSVGDQSQLVLVSRQSGTVTATGPNLGTLTDNNWYQLTATFTKSATANRFDVIISLKNWGADGLTGGTVLGTSSPLTATGLTNLYASPGVYAGFRGNSNSSGNGVRGFDDFSIIEPVTIPVINASQSTSGTVGLVFNYQLAAANSPTSYALASGSLPGGITLNSSTGLLSGTPTVDGTFAPTFTATNTAGTSPAVSVSINLIAAPSGLTTFRTTHGLAPDGSQDLETPAGDGVQNLLKYAFNMLGSGTGQAADLTTPNASILAATGSAGLPFGSIENGTGKLTITYIRRKASASPAPGITYAVEFSEDLVSWAVNGIATETVTSIDATFERVLATDTNAASPKRFARIKITAQ